MIRTMIRNASLPLLRRTFVVLSLALAAAAPTHAADITLSYAFFAPAGTFPGKQMAHWAD